MKMRARITEPEHKTVSDADAGVLRPTLTAESEAALLILNYQLFEHADVTLDMIRTCCQSRSGPFKSAWRKYHRGILGIFVSEKVVLQAATRER